MSICVVVKVPEGLVLAADSAATVEGAAVTPDGKPGPAGVLKVFQTATKVLQIRDLPLGVMTWGAGSFGARTIASLVEEFENTREIRELEANALNVKAVANSFWDFMKKKSDELFSAIPVNARPRSGLAICGYSGSEFFPEEYVMVVPTEPPVPIRTPVDNQQDFGANWYGATDAIIRFHHGRDDRLFQLLAGVGVSGPILEAVKARLMQELQYPVVFAAMPLGDAIAYAEFVVRITIDRFRFVIGAELCGGPIDIATITRREGFVWVKAKRTTFSKEHAK
jgi:hypothetical protein